MATALSEADFNLHAAAMEMAELGVAAKPSWVVLLEDTGATRVVPCVTVAGDRYMVDAENLASLDGALDWAAIVGTVVRKARA